MSAIHVLIVEDDPLIAEAHTTYLARLEGFSTVAVVHTARDAMRTAAEATASDHPIDLVLLDLGLPDASGIALASGLSGLQPAPDIIAITSERDLEMVRAAVAHGALAYLLKPFTFDDLAARLNDYRSSRARRSRPQFGDQAEVDRIFGRTGGRRPAALPKGLSPETAELILAALTDEPRSAQEYADEAGISRVSARRYLELYVQQGRAQVSLRYGNRGRPERRYTRAPERSDAP